MCSMKKLEYPIHQSMVNDPDITYSRNCHDLCNHIPQSLDYPTCADTLHMPKGYTHIHNKHGWKYENQYNDHQHEIMMKDQYNHNQDKMTPDQIRELKMKTFPYLSNDGIRLSMSDRNIVRK